MSSIAHDAIVIGGGIVGAHCAFQLTEAGLDDVVILERDGPASKASGRAAGSLTTYGQERFGAAASRFGRRFYEELAAETDAFTLHDEPEYSLAHSEEGAEHLRHDHESTSLNSQFLSPAELAEREPAFATEDITAAVVYEDSKYTDPEQLTLAVHAAASEMGVELRLAAVTDLTPGNGGVTVRTTDGCHDAPVVVVAAGAWSKRLLALAGTDLALRPRTSQIAILEPMDDLEVPAWGSGDFSVYGRPTPEGRVLFGGGVERPIPDLERFRTRAFVPFLREVGELAPYIFPALADATLYDDWAGRVSATPDRHPHIGETDVEGLYVCAGFNGEGISNGPFGGRMLADLVTGRDPLADPARFDPTRYDGDEAFRIGNAVEWWADR
jgi:sarcosine oxidase subunit beta